jgi:hypothetical protein
MTSGTIWEELKTRANRFITTIEKVLDDQNPDCEF